MPTLNVYYDHDAVLDTNLISLSGERGVILTVIVDNIIAAAGAGKYAYLHFLTAEGVSWYKGHYDCSSGSFQCLLGDTDVILLSEGKLEIQFVLTDTLVGDSWNPVGTMDGTAQPEHVLEPYTFYNTSPITKLTGTMPNRAGNNEALSDSIVDNTMYLVAPEGYYDGVDDTVYAEVNGDYVILDADDYNTAPQSLFVVGYHATLSYVYKFRLIDLKKMAVSAGVWGATGIVCNENGTSHQVFCSSYDINFQCNGQSSDFTVFNNSQVLYGQYARCIAKNDTYVFTGCNTGLLTKHSLGDLQNGFWTSGATLYGGAIYGIAADNTYIYAGGNTIQRIRKYNVSDFAYVTQSDDLGGLIRQIRHNGTNLLVCVETAKKLFVVSPVDLSILLTSDAFSGTPKSIAYDSTHVFVGCDDGYVHKLSLSDLSLVSSVYSYAGSITAMVAGGSYLYIGGATIKKVYKLLKSTLALIAMSVEYPYNIYGMDIGDTVVV